jgi:Tol biopolymer transport system component
MTSRTFSDEALTTLNLADGRRHEVAVLLRRNAPFARWSPDGRCVAMTGVDPSNRRGHFCVSAKSGDLEPLWLATGRQPPPEFEWTADGSSLVLSQPGQGIVSRRLSDGASTPLVPAEAAGLRPTGPIRLAPGDRAMAFGALRGQGKAAIRVIAVQEPVGGPVRELARAPVGENFRLQGWTPDGSEIVFSRFKPSPDLAKITYRLWAVSIRDGRLRDLDLSVPVTYAHEIALSPTGKSIAYAHFTNRRFAEMWVMRNAVPASK